MINKARLHDLHAIRGWAALIVAIAHSKYPFWSGGSDYIRKYPIEDWRWHDYIVFAVNMSTSAASVYVIIFFVLSGFFIGRNLITHQTSPLVFYGNRLIRIYIPVLGSLAISWMCITAASIVNPDLFVMADDMRPYNAHLANSYHELSLNSLLNTIIFNPTGESSFFAGNYPYWSLFYEMIFYITIPFLTKSYIFICIAASLHVLSYFIDYEWLSLISYCRYAIYFAAGFFVFQVLNSDITNKIEIWIENHTNFLVLSSLMTLFLALGVGAFKLKYLSYGLSMLSGALFILWVLNGTKTTIFRMVYPIVVNRGSVFLGNISFSLYLIHAPFLMLLYALVNLYTGKLVYYQSYYWLAVIPTILVAHLMFLVIEKPSLLLLSEYNSIYLKKNMA